jgi:hypothetical protein
MTRDNLVKLIDVRVEKHLKEFSNFKVEKGLQRLEEKSCKIGYNITYQNIRFSIHIEFIEEEINKTIDINANNIEDEFFVISDFYKHFRGISLNDLSRYLK